MSSICHISLTKVAGHVLYPRTEINSESVWHVACRMVPAQDAPLEGLNELMNQVETFNKTVSSAKLQQLSRIVEYMQLLEVAKKIRKLREKKACWMHVGTVMS